LSICRASSNVWKVGLCLALARALVAPGVASAEPAPVLLRCVTLATATSASSRTGADGRGKCAGEGEGRNEKPAPLKAPTGSASSISTSISNVNVAVGCGAACAGLERAASAPAQAAPWPAWAIAHVAEEDAMRRQDRLFQGVLMVFALIFAFVLAVHACKLAMRSADQAKHDNGLRFTSHWGGFGGSAGGWQVTPALVSLVGAGLLAATAAVIVSCILDSARPQAPSAIGMPSLPVPEKK